MGIQTIKAIECIFDWNLYPRHNSDGLDATNIRQLKEAYIVGVELPPIIVDEKSKRIIDGFHRTRMVLDVDGDEATIKADMRTYASEAEMFLAAGSSNLHGLKLSPMDRAHFIIRCRRFKIPPATIAATLGMDTSKMKDFIEKRSAKTSAGVTVPLPYSAVNLAGKTLTKEQEHYVRKSGSGSLPQVQARILLNSLKADAMILDEKNMTILNELCDLLLVILGRT